MRTSFLLIGGGFVVGKKNKPSTIGEGLLLMTSGDFLKPNKKGKKKK